MRTSRLVALACAGALAAPATASAASPDIVISQVYGGGGNAGATLKNDFIELFNRGSTPVGLTGWTVQYGSATGTTFASTALSGTLAPGRHYLVQEAAGTGGSQDLPAPDATGGIAMSATAGKVRVATAMAEVRDLVGYGAANASEGSPAPGLSNTTADLRGGEGCVDTDSNTADFTAGAPGPRNTASPRVFCEGDTAPAVTSSDPADGAANVPLGSNLRVTFSEPVTAAGGAFTLACGGADVPLTVSGDGTTFVLDPGQDLPRDSECVLTVHAAAVSDADENDPPDQMAADRRVTFTTLGIPGLQIHDIQGAGHISPYAGHSVAGVPGIVTDVESNGFYMQDQDPDRDNKTSEGIFVFSGSGARPAVGDAIRVDAQVQEFRPGGSASTNLTTTELADAAVTKGGTGTVEATVIGPDGRTPPSRIIENDTFGSVETDNLRFDPRQDGIDFFESLEGMLVQIDRPEVVGPTSTFGEAGVVAGNTGAGVRTPRGGILLRKRDSNPERMILTDAPVANVGDRFAGPVQAVVDYNFGNFMLHPTAPLTRIDRGLKQEVTSAPGKTELAVASLNVENLDARDPQAKFDRLAHILVDNLRSPDIAALEEIQDNTGAAQDDADPDASQTWQRFIDAVVAAGGPRYDYRQIDPVRNADGGEPGGNIRVGFLFRTDRGLDFVDRPGGTPTAGTSEDTSRPGAQLTFSPGRVDPGNAAWTNSRKPLAGEFRWRDRTVFVVANHFNSKGGDQPLWGRFQPPTRSSETQRHQQAAVLAKFVDALLDADRHARVVVLGDFNDFDFSETLSIVRTGGLTNLMDTLPVEQRYSYVFEGNSQTLDQILVSKELAKACPEYDSVHVNAEFSDQASDHDPQIARLNVDS